jgi:hypothetical protein
MADTYAALQLEGWWFEVWHEVPTWRSPDGAIAILLEKHAVFMDGWFINFGGDEAGAVQLARSCYYQWKAGGA